MKIRKFGLLGCGTYSRFVLEAWKKGLLKGYQPVGCFGSKSGRDQMLAEEFGIRKCSTIEELLSLEPDYIVEAANPDLVRKYAGTILENPCHLIVLSMGALADPAFAEQMEEIAERREVKIHIASGAIGGFDVLRTCALMGISETVLTNEKDVKYIRNNPVLYREQMETEMTTVIDGTAMEAIQALPTGINLGVAAALASGGLEKTRIVVNAVPSQSGERFVIEKGSGKDGVSVKIDVTCIDRMMPAWSVIALMQNLASPICLF